MRVWTWGRWQLTRLDAPTIEEEAQALLERLATHREEVAHKALKLKRAGLDWTLSYTKCCKEHDEIEWLMLELEGEILVPARECTFQGL